MCRINVFSLYGDLGQACGLRLGGAARYIQSRSATWPDHVEAPARTCCCWVRPASVKRTCRSGERRWWLDIRCSSPPRRDARRPRSDQIQSAASCPHGRQAEAGQPGLWPRTFPTHLPCSPSPLDEVAYGHNMTGVHEDAGRLGRVERRVIGAVTACATAALGGHSSNATTPCDTNRSNSCLHRHCPKCDGLARAQGLAERKPSSFP